MPKQSDEFWQTCHDCDITLWITHYPIKIDKDAIKQKAMTYDVKFFWAEHSGEKLKKMWKVPYDLRGNQDPNASFQLCPLSNRCSHIQDGKFWPCITLNNIASFNKYFKKDLKISETDYLDILNIKDKDEIFEFTRHPVPFCRYCDIKNTVFGLPWAVSKKDISEWT